MSKTKLGELLFFDPILSADSSISCASCHRPEFAFADTIAFSLGVAGRLGKRNAPSVMNMSDRESFFWDGRAATLEAQATFPIEDHNEMDLPITEAIVRLNKSKKYRALFTALFGEKANKKNLGIALAAFERTLETSNTALDRWQNDEKKDTLNTQQIRGRELFFSKAKCNECHFTGDFTADEFRGIGLFDGKKHNDSGRYIITKNKADIGKFKVPGLRNIALTAPYMHDGSLPTLEAVIEHYTQPDYPADAPIGTGIALNSQQKTQLKAFLQSLTDPAFLQNERLSSPFQP
jgi:cytochrome c peroxidase